MTLDQLVADGPAVIVFYRGGWCPYCNLALRTYQRELLPELVGFRRASSPSVPSHPISRSRPPRRQGSISRCFRIQAAHLAKRIGISFQQSEDVLEAQRKLGLDLAQVNAEGSTELPRPTVLIVDREHTVRFVDVQPDYTARTEVADILRALSDMGTDRPLN